MNLRRSLASLTLVIVTVATGRLPAEPADSTPRLRPPSVPLVTHDPYFSIWSPADKLTDADTVHWTGKPHRLTSLVQIDGKAFRLMGKEASTENSSGGWKSGERPKVPAFPQRSVEVLPTLHIRR